MNKKEATDERRSLGKSGLEVSALGLGRMNMTGPYGPPQDTKEMVANEELLGEVAGLCQEPGDP